MNTDTTIIDSHFSLPSGIGISASKRAAYALFKSALHTNKLYFLLTIFGMSANQDQLRYNASTNKLLQDTIVGRSSNNLPVTISNHEVIMILLSYYETTVVYSLIRHLLDIILGHEFLQVPWIPDKEMRSHKNNADQIEFRKYHIISRITRDLSSLSDASEFHQMFAFIHSTHALQIRNAIAHGSFAYPNGKSDLWEFGTYRLRDGKVTLDRLEVSQKEMHNFISSIVSFRIGIYKILDRYRTLIRGRTFALTGTTLTRNPESYNVEFQKETLHFINGVTVVERDSMFEN